MVRRPRLRVWTLLLLLALAVALGAYALHGRTQKYRAMAAVHARATELMRSQVDPVSVNRSAAWQAWAKYHSEMALKYERAAWRPWESAPPDSPEPPIPGPDNSSRSK
jgi:type VI protein secretion system component VasK